MSINEKYLGQASEATARFWIDTNLLSPSKKDKPVIFLWWYSWESITLAQAISDIASDVCVVLNYRSNLSWDQWFVEFKNGGLIPAFLRRPDYEHTRIEYQEPTLTWNAHNIESLCWDKYYTNFVLKQNWIPVPKQARLISGVSETQDTTIGKIDRIKYYKNTVWTKFVNGHVVKTRIWSWGNGVVLVRDTQCDLQVWDLLPFWCVIEELIESYPIEFSNWKKDWNLRVLVTFDPKKERYVTAWITWRLDNEWWPVNRSRGAENISFEDLAKLCWWSEEEFLRIKDEVMRTAELSSEILVQAWNRKNTIPKYTNFQTLFWVDIIVDKDMKPQVIEVNASDSWCIYELWELEWIESIYPIAQAVVHKAKLWYNMPHIVECLKTIADQIWMDYSRLVLLYNSWKIIITENPDWSLWVDIPEEFLNPWNPE